MPPVGSDQSHFELGGQRIECDGERCLAADGTLAGSNLTMAQAVANAIRLMGVDAATAIAMASKVPAAILGLAGERGSIGPGMRADLLLVDAANTVLECWIEGQSAF
jgi:N-acetylglucosamine-6-phosphate deacetylase